MQIQYGPGDDDFGPFYAYKKQGEDFDGWQKRVRSDIEWGQAHARRPHLGVQAARLRAAVRQLRPGRHQRPKIPDDLLGWLSDRYDAIFTQDVNFHVRTGDGPPLGRFQITRDTTGGDLHERLLSGDD